MLGWLRRLATPAPHYRGPTHVPVTSPEDRIMAARRNDEAATIRLRMEARVRLLDAEAEVFARESEE